MAVVSDNLSLIQVTQTCLILWGWERTELSVLFSSGVHAKSLQLKLTGKNSHLQLRIQLKWTLRPTARTIQPHAPLQRGEMTGWAFRTMRWRAVWWKVRDEWSLIQCEQNIDIHCEWSERQAMTCTSNHAIAFHIYSLLHDKRNCSKTEFWVWSLNWMWWQKACASWNNAKTFLLGYIL